MFNPNWHKWIYASIAKHFVIPNVTIFVVGDDRKTADLSEWVELRIEGPHTSEESQSSYKLDVKISLMVNVVKTAANIYRPHEIAGKLTQLMTTISVLDYGREFDPYNPFAVQFCLPLVSSVRWAFLGQANPDVNVVQGVVSANYSVKL